MHSALPSIGPALRDLLLTPPTAASAARPPPRSFPAVSDAALLGRSLLCAPSMLGLHSRVQWPPMRADALRCARADGCALTGKRGLMHSSGSGTGGSIAAAATHASATVAAAAARSLHTAAAPPSVPSWSAANGVRPRQPSPPAPTLSSQASAHASAAAATPVQPAASANPWNRHVVAPAAGSQAGFSRDPRDPSSLKRANPAGGGAYQRDDGPPSSQHPQYRNGGGAARRTNDDDDSSDGGRFKRSRGSNSSVSSASPTPPDPDAAPALPANPFVTGTDKLMQDAIKKHGSKAAAEAALRRDREASAAASVAASTSSTAAKSLGGKRKGFVPPYAKKDDGSSASSSGPINPMLALALAGPHGKEGEVHPRLQGLDPKLIEMITMDMMSSPGVKWEDIAGLEFAKKTIREIVVWPLLRPDMFTGLRGPPKGLLLFGPPGTGKTLIGKCVASESRCKFFSISASSLTSKWHGEGEKLVRTLFAVANVHEPSIIFIDEIDSLLSQRQDAENEAGRRIKTEFLVQLDGCNTTGKERVLVVGATNRPQELDEAARRRLVKKLYIPLPDYASRMQLLRNTMAREGVDHCLSEADFETIVNRAAGYSGSDMAALCTESSMGPIRSLSSVMDTDDISKMDSANVRPIAMQDFDVAFKSIRPSVNQKDLAQYVAWNKQYGSFPMAEGDDVFCSTPPRTARAAPTNQPAPMAPLPAAAAGVHAEYKE